MKRLLGLTLILLAVNSYAQTDSTRQVGQVAPNLYPQWTFFVPGGTHFHDKHILEGIIFSGIEVSGVTLGIIYDNKLKSGSTTPYYNFPLLLGMQAFQVDKCDYLRNKLEYEAYRHPDFKYDPIPFKDLLKAPFQPKNVFTPITGAFVVAAAVELFLNGRNVNHRFRDIEKMYVLNGYMDRDPAMAIYGATSLAASYGAGISEEYFFRNSVMPLLDYRYGQKKGLIYSSLIFGSAHFGNLLFSDNPDIGSTLLQVAEASIAGYFLGRDVQKRDYKIGAAVAAHMWYDFTLMLGSFLIDPENNFLGVRLQFKLE